MKQIIELLCKPMNFLNITSIPLYFYMTLTALFLLKPYSELSNYYKTSDSNGKLFRLKRK